MHMVSQALDKPIHPTLATDVQVWTEKDDGQQRRITASIIIPYSIESVWQVLTDYERMPEFIPNLVKTQRILHPLGGIRIDQIGYCRLLNIKFSARVVLDMVEEFPDRIRFDMVEGDFQVFSGSCRLERIADSQDEKTRLNYSVQVVPKFTMPVALLERQLQRDLPLNLLAIRQRLDARSSS